MAKRLSLDSSPPVDSELIEARLKLKELRKRRTALKHQIIDLEEQMYALAFRRLPRRSLRPRFKNETTLRELVLIILKRSRKGMTVDEVTEKAREAGYRTRNKSLRLMVYFSLYHHRNRTEVLVFDETTERYILKKETAEG